MSNLKAEVKFVKHGIKVNGVYCAVSYSSSKNNTKGNAVIASVSGFGFNEEFKKAFKIENDSDSMTDYFESDKIRISMDSEYFLKVESLARMQEERFQVKTQKHEAKMKLKYGF